MRIVLVCLAIVFNLSAGTLTVRVKDPSGSAVAGAAVEARGSSGAAQSGSTGKAGSVTLSELAAGVYRVSVRSPGFADFVTSAEVKASGDTAVEATLVIAPQETSVEVEEKTTALANSDPNYRRLRDAQIIETFLVENLEFQRDAATFVLRSGTLSFSGPVLGRVPIAVFSGHGSFRLTPAVQMEAEHIRLITGQPDVNEEFESAVFAFTDKSYEELKQSLKTPADGAANQAVLRDLRHLVRRRTETPRSISEYLLQGSDVDNVEAEILADLYNPSAEGFFCAYVHGRKRSDLRFYLKPRGALPQMLSTEEVGLVNLDFNSPQDGILYLTHRTSEWRNGTALQDEDRRIAAARHYKIETVIGKNEHLASVTTLRFEPLRDGDRVFKLSLLPNLRVSRVSLLGSAGGKEIGFIQEPRRLDSSFYLVLPESAVRGKTQEVRIEYAGDKVIHNAGGGTFSVGARTDWYPSLNPFHDHATYDLTFRVPRRYTLVSVGKPVENEREDEFMRTRWISDVPLAVAGFNYGEFKKKDMEDGGYGLEVYATSELPDYMRFASRNSAMNPMSLAASTLVDAENSMRCFRAWFGDIPYGRIAITQQPEFNFGQSWPSLVYLPLFAFLDSTQRYMLMGSHTFKFSEFIDEVTPHEVSHQWWGHLVGWNSYHDQWLSEGFADFSAGLFLEYTNKDRSAYLKYWERHRKAILEKTSFGYAPNDAGPIWMGIRLDTAKTANAYNSLVYPKGAFVLHMLRYLMQDSKTGDADFIAMMHDFTAKYAGKNASSGDFQGVVEQHMKPAMDLDGNHHMNWFFAQWVFGAEVPSYHMTYHLAPEPGGKFMFTAKIVQSGVDDHFRSRIPIYLDFGMPGGPQKLGNVGVSGNQSSEEIKVRLPQKPKKVMLNYNFDVLAREASSEEI